MAKSSSKLVFVSALILVLFGPVGIDVYLPALPAMQHDLATSQSLVQLSLTSFTLALGLGQLVVGPLADRVGRKPVALGGLVVYALSSLAIAVASTIESILVLRLIQGFGASCCSVVSMTVVRDRFSPTEGAKIYSYINGALCVAPALAPVLGGILVEIFGWRSNFYFLFGCTLLGLFFVITKMPETLNPKVSTEQSFANDTKRVLGSGRFYLFSLICALCLAVLLNFAMVSPAVLMSKHGASSLQFSLLFGANALVLMVSSFVAPRVIGKAGRHRSVLYGSVLMFVGGLSLSLVLGLLGSSIVGFLLPIAIASFGFSLVLGAAASLTLEPFESCAGLASAFLGCIQFLGASVFTALLILFALGSEVSQSVAMLCAGAYGLFVYYRTKVVAQSEL